MRGITISSGASIVLAALVLAGSAAAGDLFTASISIGGGTPVTRDTNKARQIPEFFDDGSLLEIDPGYDPTQAVAASLDLRGLEAAVSFDALSNTLRFQVPGAGIDVSFDGASRAEAQENFEDWLKGDLDSALAPDEEVTKLLQGLVEHSPVDPVAGNPNSLQSRMFAADWRVGTRGGLGAFADGGIAPSFFRFNLAGGIYDADDFDVYAAEVNLGSGIGFGERLALRFDVPVTYTSTEGSATGMASGGLSLSVKPVSWWTLTPAARVGGVGSVDVGGAAVIYSGTVTSHVRIPLGPLAIGIGNMGGVAETMDGIEAFGYDFEYDLTNWVTRNGAYLEGTFGSATLGTGFGWRIYGSDVRFFGDDLYMDNYQEAGAAVAAGLPFGGIGLDVSFIRGRNYEGVSGRLSLRF